MLKSLSALLRPLLVCLIKTPITLHDDDADQGEIHGMIVALVIINSCEPYYIQVINI